MIDIERAVRDAARELLAMARGMLLDQGTFLPTAVIHTEEGLYPTVLPFKTEEQRKQLVESVKEKAVEMDAYAVTTLTCARLVDSRTGVEEETVVLTTVIQGGEPYTVVQPYTRDENRSVLCFGEISEGDAAAMPGQMTIYPEWPEETVH